MKAHLFITVNNKEDEETEIRILYDTFMVSVYKGEVTIDPYSNRSVLDFVLGCHRDSSAWEEQPCSW